MNNAAFLYKFLKFIIVGGFGFGIDLLTTWLFRDCLRLKTYIANSLGFTIGMLFRFVFNRIWTFQSTDPDWGIQFIKFMSIAGFGLLIVNYTIYLLTEKRQLMKFYPAKIISMIAFFIYNFTLNYLITFTG